MKRLIAAVLSACMILSLVACGGGASSADGTADGTAASSQQGNSEANSSIEVDKGLLTTTITLPASFFETFYDSEAPFDAECAGTEGDRIYY